MFLEKYSRYFRRYELIFKPRHKYAPYMPLVAEAGHFSIVDALENRINEGKAFTTQSNGDVVELMKVAYRLDDGVVVLLFHRGSPDAADPTYRKREKAGVTVRTAEKEPDEEQSVSAHLVISAATAEKGVHRAVLEEIPGLSMALLQAVIAQALAAYPYEYETKKKQVGETHCLVKAVGIKSETIGNALKTGKLDTITFARRGPAEYVDSEGLWEPMDDVLRLRVTGKVDAATWSKKLGALVKKAAADGWEKFNLEIALDDKRSRTVPIDREQDAREVLFVRSDQVSVKSELPVCSVAFQDELIEQATTVLSKGEEAAE